MAANMCPKCGHVNRPGAKFCGSCAAPLVAAQPVAVPAPAPSQAAPTQPVAPRAMPAPAPPAPAPSPPVAGALGGAATAAAAPVVKQAAQVGWAGSRLAMGKIAWLLTAGGRSAYTEITGAVATTEGQVAGAPSERLVPLRIEPAALAWLAVAILGWLVFLLPAWQGLALLLGALVALVVVVYVGGRRPYFSALTLMAVIDRIRNKGQGQMPMYRFDLSTPGEPQPAQIVMLGPRTPAGAQVGPGELTRVWGIADPGRNEIQAWQIERVAASGQSGGKICSPRLIPFSLALFVPILLMLVVRLLTLRS